MPFTCPRERAQNSSVRGIEGSPRESLGAGWRSYDPTDPSRFKSLVPSGSPKLSPKFGNERKLLNTNLALRGRHFLYCSAGCQEDSSSNQAPLALVLLSYLYTCVTKITKWYTPRYNNWFIFLRLACKLERMLSSFLCLSLLSRWDNLGRGLMGRWSWGPWPKLPFP